MDRKIYLFAFVVCISILMHESQAKLPALCMLKAESGTGSKRQPRYYYDFGIKDCIPFVYNGEGGNANNFQSIEECKKICGVK